ncbi:restriction endonuclease subunit S [Streptococcus cristatus]|uniref:restriction endonuclease subunit S n=1 Tax=Streptococcus cristatus TaxID=45634 RepID=UPI002000F5B5|nr:restriction endonuclease subunit S [Streptococcus cristatus]
MIKVNKPKIRFNEFENIWTKSKLGKLYEIYSGNTPSRSDSRNYQNGEIPWIKTTDLNNSIICSNEEKISVYGATKLKVLPEKSVLIAMYGGFNQIGRTGLLAYPATINQALAALMPVNEINPNFLLNFLNFKKESWRNVAASSRKDPNITKNDVEKFKISFPSLDEQSAIGSLFRTLDDLLASYKDNLANYQSLKATMLSKMFPKAGQIVPEIRLDGFEGKWEEKKLGEIVDIIGGGTPDTNVKEYWNGEINWFSPTEVGNSIYLDTSEKRISELGLQKSSAKILPANRTILFTSRAGIGSVGIITKDSTTNQGFQSLVTKQGIDIYFLFSYSSEITRYALKHSAGSTFLEISGKELGKMDIIIPTYEEQQAIGSYFSNLDQLITSYQDKITQLETLKKKLLQDMFI